MINVFKEIHPRNPVLVAAWPGMGQVAVYAARYLKDKLKAKLFAKLDGKDFFYQSDVVIHDGIIEPQDFPLGKFYYWENKTGPNDLIIFLSDMQPHPEKLNDYLQVILNFTSLMGIKKIFTFAAMVTSVDYLHFPKVRVAATDQAMQSRLQQAGLKTLKAGQISGLNGFLLGAAKKRDIPGACFLGDIPFYSTQIDNPRTSHAILNSFLKLMDLNLDLSELTMAARKMEEEIGRLMDVVYHNSREEGDGYDEPGEPINGEDIEQMKQLLSTPKVLPDSVMRQIEVLFKEAQANPAGARDLKKFLDDWHIYKEYEDRFLELFKVEDKKDFAC